MPGLIIESVPAMGNKAGTDYRLYPKKKEDLKASTVGQIGDAAGFIIGDQVGVSGLDEYAKQKQLVGGEDSGLQDPNTPPPTPPPSRPPTPPPSPPPSTSAARQ